MNEIEIYERAARYVEDSGYYVRVDSSMPYVAITHTDAEQCVYLRSYEAELFISEAMQLYNELQHIGLNTLYLALAKPYIECIGT